MIRPNVDLKRGYPSVRGYAAVSADAKGVCLYVDVADELESLMTSSSCLLQSGKFSWGHVMFGNGRWRAYVTL